MGTNPPSLGKTGLAKSALNRRVPVLSHQGWWLDSRLSSKEWALHWGLYSGAGLIWRWWVRHGLGRCVTDWACCHCRQSQRCALQGRYPPPSCGTLSCRLLLTWPSSMTMPPAILLVLCVISCKTGMSVFCHGQQRARFSIPLSMPGTCWIRGWGLGPFPPEVSRNLQVPWWKRGETSHSKNWQIWCSPSAGDALEYLMQLVPTPDTDCYFDFDPPPFVQGHIIQFLLVTCLWNVFSLCLSCWILLCSYKYLHKINAVDSERTFLFLFSLYAKTYMGDWKWCRQLHWWKLQSICNIKADPPP